MLIGKTVTVECANRMCEQNGTPVEVNLAEVARNVLAVPRLICKKCDCELKPIVTRS